MRDPAVDLQKRVGENVRALRERRHLTLAEAAELIGVDDRYLRRIEAGAFNLGLGSLVRIALTYEVDPHVLLRPRSGPPTKRRPGRPKRGPRA